MGSETTYGHPKKYIEKRTNDKKIKERIIGYCYCGALQKTLLDRKTKTKNKDKRLYFVVCSKTGKSIKKCM